MGGTIRVQFDDSNKKPSEDMIREVPPIASNAELSAVMRTDAYKQSSLGRALVVEALKKSPANVGDLQPKVADIDVDVANEAEARHAAARSMFRDPRYKSDPLYRYQVTQKILTESKGEVGSGSTARLQTMGPRGGYPEVQRSGVVRVQFDAQMSGPEKPEPQPVEPPDPNVIDLGY